MTGLTLNAADTPLTERAADFLSGGPADAQTLISYVCQVPSAPQMVCEHMAAALLAGHRRFARATDGRWHLREQTLTTVAGAVGEIAIRDLRHESFVVVDVETTGARAGYGDRITEIAVVKVQNGVATPVFDTLVNPERPIPPMITALTNISWDMVKHAPKFAEVCDQLLGVLEGHVFVAHNATFDWRFVTMEVERATRRQLHGRTLCTVRLARRLLPQLRRRNLDSLAAFYGIDIVGRHRAGGDAVATAHAFLRLLDAARDRGCISLDDVDRVLAQRTGRRKRRRRPPSLPHSASDDSYA